MLVGKRVLVVVVSDVTLESSMFLLVIQLLSFVQLSRPPFFPNCDWIFHWLIRGSTQSKQISHPTFSPHLN